MSSSTVTVKCGTATGILYINKINAPGSKGSLKCIHSDSIWYSPTDFGILGGKDLELETFHHMHDNLQLQLGIYLSSFGTHPDKPSSPSSTTGSSSAEVAVDCHDIVDIKFYQSLQATW